MPSGVILRVRFLHADARIIWELFHLDGDVSVRKALFSGGLLPSYEVICASLSGTIGTLCTVFVRACSCYSWLHPTTTPSVASSSLLCLEDQIDLRKGWDLKMIVSNIISWYYLPFNNSLPWWCLGILLWLFVVPIRTGNHKFLPSYWSLSYYLYILAVTR